MPRKTTKAPARSFASTMSAIAWSFVGLRRKRDFDQDVEGGMNPVYVIGCALLGTALLIGVLVGAARLALS